jgi:hypothetical protein
MTTRTKVEINNNNQLHELANVINAINSIKDLQKQELKLVDYNVLFVVWHELEQSGVAATFMQSVANWFKKHDCKVQMESDGINYIIMI